MKRLLLLCAVFALAACEGSGGSADPGKLPNFIVIMADDLGAPELGCYGHPRHKTPNLDRLAAEGVRFLTCYSTPLCHPTRFEIMTGQYGHHNGIYNFTGRRGGPHPDSREEQISNHLTFAQVLKSRGYATAHAGKWQLTGKVPTLIRETGFDEYSMWAYRFNLPPGVEHAGGWEGKKGGVTSRYWHPSILQNGKYLQTKPDDYGPDLHCSFIIDFIRRHKEGPFFVYYPMLHTHNPQYATPDTVKDEKEKFLNLIDQNYQANLQYLDKLIGRLVSALDELGIRDNTLIIFTGDNGTGGRGKGKATELGSRVPLIVAGADIVTRPGVRRELVDLSDVFPTLVELSGARLPAGHIVDGRSFAPYLRGEKGNPREWIYSYLADRRVVRTERWLLEDNSPHLRGRLFDCGDSRDGTGYKDVTESQDPEAQAAWKMMESILADKKVPLFPEDGPTNESVKPKR